MGTVVVASKFLLSLCAGGVAFAAAASSLGQGGVVHTTFIAACGSPEARRAEQARMWYAAIHDRPAVFRPDLADAVPPLPPQRS